MTEMSTQAYEIKEKLAELEAALLASTPDMPLLLQRIHKQLKADPDLVTILSDEEAGILVRGLKKHTSTVITAAAVKAKPKKSLKQMTLADL